MSFQTSYSGQAGGGTGRVFSLGISRWLAGLGLSALLLLNPSARAQTQSPPPLGLATDVTNSLGDWIWAAKTLDGQVCLFWRGFDLPTTNTVKRAMLHLTVDNGFVLFLDGQELGRGLEWEEIYSAEVTALLHPGRHVLAVKGINAASAAGMIFGLRIEFADGQVTDIKSDTEWRIAPESVKGWETHFDAAPDWEIPIRVGQMGLSPRWSRPERVTPLLPVTTPIIEPPDPANNPTGSLGAWIWAAKTLDRQECLFWRAFDLPPTNAVKRARLRMTVDNEFVLFLNGRELGRGSEWREIYWFDVTALLPPGRQVLAVRGVNSFGFAGMIFGLWIEFADGQILEIKSDAGWQIAPEATKGWEKQLDAAADWATPIVVGQIGVMPRWQMPQNVNIMPTLQPLVIRFWQRAWFQISVLVLLGLITMFSLWLLAQLAFHRKEQLLLERERARIAADIHDDLGSRVTQLVLHGEVAQSELLEDAPVRPQLERICEEARQVLTTMDEVLWAVNPERDTLRDFTAFVCCHAEEFLKPTNIQCRLEVEPEMPVAPLDLPLRRNLLMAIKETLNNAVKHSEATELLLQIYRHGQKLHVVVQDNGKGFVPATANAERHGLVNMTRRMQELGGVCRITSQPGAGCRTEFVIPLQRPPGSLWRWLGQAPPPAAVSYAVNSDPQNHDISKK